MLNNKHQADVIIAGGGLAGIVTALELLNYDKKVIIFDRDKAEEFGGLAKWSFGGMFFANSPHQRKAGINDSCLDIMFAENFRHLYGRINHGTVSN